MGFETITKDTIKGKAIRELQAWAQVPLAGAAAATDIALAGATVEKTTVVGVMEVIHDPNGGGAGVSSLSFADRTSEAAITSDGNLQLSTTDTTGSILLVSTVNKP